MAGRSDPVVSDEDHISRKAGGRRFQTTQWNLVLEAADRESPRFRESLATLCRLYWLPVYAYVRRRGHDVDSAQDLTQEFFSLLIEKNYVRGVQREKGRFRTFLLVAVKRFLANEWDRAHARKRGGADSPLPLELADAERRYRTEPADEETPEKTFERRWALTLLDRTYARLREELNRSGHPERTRRLMELLTGSGDALPYAEVAREFGQSKSAIKSAVHRMRVRFGALLREEVAETVDAPERIDDEIRHLFAAVGD
jgi:RNA polymerase sigma-70 factor (ECF subfamily)